MPPVSQRTISVILGGGAGSRLFPLTKERAKPAVPLGGKYRLVDIPISNCINSGLRRIFLLTQFNSTSLARHVTRSYRFDEFSAGFVEVLAAQQTPMNADWYQGTADAVRQNVLHFNDHPHDLVLILSGDQLYRMDFSRVLHQHVESGAEVTVATIPVPRDQARGFGIMQVDEAGRIVRFVEKPQDEGVLESLRLAGGDRYLASMGIYVFDRRTLIEALEGANPDFGKDIIPSLIGTRSVYSYVFEGYWEDIGTIAAFYEANLNLCDPVPQFDFFDQNAPIYTRARYLPGSKITNARLSRAVLSDGCVIMDATIERSLIGLRSRIQQGAVIRESVVMGQDYYETDHEIGAAAESGIPPCGIGRGSFVERAIIDKNARIGDNVRISPEGKAPNVDGENWYIRDGIVVIPKNAIVPSGTVI